MVIILHEGNTDKNFIKKLLDYLEIPYNNDNFSSMNNKSNFFKQDYIAYKVLKTKIQTNEIEKVLFIIDADNEKDNNIYGGYNNTLEQLEKTIKNLSFIKNYEIFISCDKTTKEGYLESLILSTVPENLKNCYESFMHCSNYNSKDNHKTIMTKLHELTQPNKPYDFSHDNFDELKSKLTALFSTNKKTPQ